MAELIKPQVRGTVQSSVRDNNETSTGIMYWMAQAGTIIAPWWSTVRDNQLREFWRDSDHFAGAMYMISSKLTSVPRRVEPRDMSVRSYVKLADHYNALLEEGIAFGPVGLPAPITSAKAPLSLHQ